MTPQKLPNGQAGMMTVPSPQRRRHLPIEQKKKVFNEWGAVLRHQDEMEQKNRQNELAQ